MALNPGQHFRRKQAATTLHDTAIDIPKGDSYALFNADELPNTSQLVAECRTIFDQKQASGNIEAKMSDVSKAFLVPVNDTSDELMANDIIRDFVLSDEMLAIVSNYFGAVPILSHVNLLWTPPNDTFLKSQQYHYDTEDYRQLKIFVNIFEVTPEAGPFTFIGGDISQQVEQKTGYVGGRRARLDDDSLEKSLGSDQEPLTVTGPAGSGIFVDTSRCLHFGSRGNTKQRLVLMIQFLNYFAPKIEPTNWAKIPETFGTLPKNQPDITRRLVLRC